jgi:hypothetical protein
VSATIAVAVPTTGRPSLDVTLRAIAEQGLIPGDDVIVVYDRHCGPQPDLRARVEAFGPQFTSCEHDHGVSDHGLFQSNVAFASAQSDYVLAHSDDDLYLPGAFDTLRATAEAHPHQPILFQAISPNRRLSWIPGKPKLQRGRLGGQSLAMPREYLSSFRMEERWRIDFAWILEVLDKAQAAGHEPVWIEDVLMLSRPTDAERREHYPSW